MTGSKQGELEVFLNLPGSPDNIRKTDHNTLIVPLVIARSPDLFRVTPLDLLGEYPLLRKYMSMVRKTKAKCFKYIPFVQLIFVHAFILRICEKYAAKRIRHL